MTNHLRDARNRKPAQDERGIVKTDEHKEILVRAGREQGCSLNDRVDNQWGRPGRGS